VSPRDTDFVNLELRNLVSANFFDCGVVYQMELYLFEINYQH